MMTARSDPALLAAEQAVFEREITTVTQRYFPGWRTWRSWSIRCLDRSDIHGFHGKCLFQERELQFTCPVDPGRWWLRALVIHECCHAILGQGHTPAWRRKMLQAARTAELWESDTLAALLRMDVSNYRGRPRQQVQIFHRRHREQIRCDQR